jgi:uncharacterized protein
MRAAELVRKSAAERRGALTTESVVGETCTLLVARGRAHLVPRFLDMVEQSRWLCTVPVDQTLFTRTKDYLRRHLDHRYSFVDCTSFVVMAERGLCEAATTDAHFSEAGWVPLLR